MLLAAGQRGTAAKRRVANGPSFIAHRFRDALAGIQIAATGLSAFSQVRIGYRMPTQLGLLERFHGTLKAEEVYWNRYADPVDARQKLGSSGSATTRLGRTGPWHPPTWPLPRPAC